MKAYYCFKKINNRWKKFRLSPISVYCFHHVSSKYEEKYMYRPDWVSIQDFKNRILDIKKDGCSFISLSESYEHIKNDYVRRKKYAALTFDDGFASLKEILPWLKENNIPVTLFINGYVLDGKSFRYNSSEKYLTYDDLFSLNYSSIEIGSHGWDHRDLKIMTIDEFASSISRNTELLKKHPRYIPFWAYTYGTHTEDSDRVLYENGLIPVLTDGMVNYNEPNKIHREL